jgi:hypothetical protein
VPISIADMAQRRRTFSMVTEWGPVQWTYRPYQMTPAREAEIERIVSRANQSETDQGIANTDRGIDKLVIQFCEIVEATDMMGPLYPRIDPKTGMGIGEAVVEAGDTIPIEPRTVRHFSGRFIIDTLRAIGIDSRPKKEMLDD